MSTELQKFLRQGNTLADLWDRYNVRTNRHPLHTNLVQFTYEGGCDFGEQIVCESRGIILDEENDWACVARPFDKFFNLGERPVDFDWNNFWATEKRDGTLIILYWYKDRWYFATKGSLSATNFREPVERLLFRYISEPTCLDPELTYCLEYTAPTNRIVVQYTEERLTLIGMRYPGTGQECLTFTDPFPKAPIYEYPLHALVEIVKKMVGTEAEGFVLCDRFFNRIKLKAPDYVRLHQIRPNFPTMTDRHIKELVRTGEYEEVIAYFPEYAPIFHAELLTYNELLNECEKKYQQVQWIDDQKQFALAIQDFRYKSALFARRRYGIPFRQFFKEQVTK